MKTSSSLVIMVAVTLLSACANQPIAAQETIEIDVPDNVLSELGEKIPTQDYVFYVPSDAPPTTLEEMQQWKLVACVAETNIWTSAAFTLKFANSSIAAGTDDASIRGCLNAAYDPKTIVLTKRSNELPDGVTMQEVVFK